MKKAVLAIVAFIVVGMFALYAHYGGFYKIEIAEKEMGPYNFIYEVNSGNYAKTVDSVNKIMNFAINLGVTPTYAFGRFLDDPTKVEENKLRSEAGVIVTNDDLEKLKNKLGQLQYKLHPKIRAVAADFPIKGYLSIPISIWRVYPALMKYMDEKNIGVTYSLEVYDFKNKMSTFAFPIVAK